MKPLACMLRPTVVELCTPQIVRKSGGSGLVSRHARRDEGTEALDPTAMALKKPVFVRAKLIASKIIWSKQGFRET